MWNLSRDQRRGFRWTRDLPGQVKSATVSCAAGVWHPTCQSIARLHVRAANRRRDFAHKTSTHLAKNHGLVAIEALAVQSMTRSVRGTVEEPGRHVRQKAGLNRAILDKAGA